MHFSSIDLLRFCIRNVNINVVKSCNVLHTTYLVNMYASKRFLLLQKREYRGILGNCV